MAAIPQNLGVPTGTVMWSAAPEVPVGWLLCDGRFVTAEDYPALYAAIGNTYGGDAVTFQLPDLVGRFIKGAGDPGRQPFTYEDGVNKDHRHGMYANQTHTHGVTDPGHEHPTSSGAHQHNTTSNHSHTNTATHNHGAPTMRTHTYVLIRDCSQELYGNIGGDNQCSRNPDMDYFITEKISYDSRPWYNGKTGITAVNANFTGTSVQVAYTGVTLATQVTDITLAPSVTNMSVDQFGVVGGPQPKNIAFLPIIRT